MQGAPLGDSDKANERVVVVAHVDDVTFLVGDQGAAPKCAASVPTWKSMRRFQGQRSTRPSQLSMSSPGTAGVQT